MATLTLKTREIDAKYRVRFQEEKSIQTSLEIFVRLVKGN